MMTWEPWRQERPGAVTGTALHLHIRVAAPLPAALPVVVTGLAYCGQPSAEPHPHRVPRWGT
jgi:hypothetical protein